MTIPPSTLLVCDDHPLMRSALVDLMRTMFAYAHIREAGTFEEARERAAGCDLCICDLVMPGADSYDGVDAVLHALSGAPLLIVTAIADQDVMMRLLKMRVVGFVPKDAKRDVLRAAIKVVLSGEGYVPARLLSLSPEVASPSPQKSISESPRLLSAQQARIMPMIASGLTNKEIARNLGLAPSTIKTHVDAIMRGLGARNRQESVSKFMSSTAVKDRSIFFNTKRDFDDNDT